MGVPRVPVGAWHEGDLTSLLAPFSLSQTTGLWKYFAFFGALIPEQEYLPPV